MLWNIIKAIILGIVQGITEWLPISSTGHMILVDELIQMQASAAFMEMFFVVIQLASVLAVVLLYWNELNPVIRTHSGFSVDQDILSIWPKVIVGVIPAGVIGFLFDDWFTENFFNWYTVALALIIYGVLFIIIEHYNKKRTFDIKTWDDLSYQVALMIGLFQVLALVPGTSRSGATIIGALLIGTARPIAAKFSFFLSIPIMFGASFLKLVRFGFNFTGDELVLLLAGCLFSFVVSVFAIKFLMNYIRKNDFSAFGWYRIVIGLLVIGYFGILVA